MNFLLLLITVLRMFALLYKLNHDLEQKFCNNELLETQDKNSKKLKHLK